MTVFEITSVPQQPRKPTRCVLQSAALLDIYQAELAPVLEFVAGTSVCLQAVGKVCNRQQPAGRVRRTAWVFSSYCLAACRATAWPCDTDCGWKTQRLLVDVDRMSELLEQLRRSGA